MDFDFSDDQQALREAVAKWVEKSYDFERRQQIVKSGGFDRAVYNELAELGLTGIYVSEEYGGMGMGPVEAMVVLEELGRGIVTEPLAQAFVTSAVIQAYGSDEVKQQWLPKIASGEALVVLAHQERAARYRLNHVTTRATKAGNGWTLSGAKSLVPAGDEADAFIVPARSAGADTDATGIALFLVAKGAQGLAVRGYPTQDGARAAELTLKDTPTTLIATDALPVLEHAVDAGIAAVCAEGVGVMDRLVAITAEYMNTRKQFGVAIASFQALRHRMADVKMQLELGRSMSYFASLKMAEPAAARRRALAQAKYQLSNSMRFVGQQCIQLHGGIGVTDEYIGSHYFKRLTMLEMAFGDSLHQLGEVSARMQDTAGVFA